MLAPNRPLTCVSGFRYFKYKSRFYTLIWKYPFAVLTVMKSIILISCTSRGIYLAAHYAPLNNATT